MVGFSRFEGSGRGMVLGEPRPFKGVACCGRRAGRGMVQAMPRPLPVFVPWMALFGGHATTWVAYAAALKGFWDFEILGLGI